jgi:hypothetical protein
MPSLHVLQGLSHSLTEAEETKKLNEAMAQSNMLVAGGKNRKWMAIPMAAKRAKGGAHVAAMLMQNRIPNSISPKKWEVCADTQRCRLAKNKMQSCRIMLINYVN